MDAHAMMVYLEREPGFETVGSVFINAVEKDNKILMSSVNYGEVYYIILRECGIQKAEEVINIIDSLPIDIIPADRDLAIEAGNYKAVKRMSYADSFAAALAKVNKAELITGDNEFREVEGEIKILWIV
jgi:predicted nucleic acid-binding protein